MASSHRSEVNELAPGVPPDYYRSMYDVEERHWWYLGMSRIAAAILGERLRRQGQRLLDAGCGTGGFLRWALDSGSFDEAVGIDLSSAALELARERAPEATFRAAPVSELPLESSSVDLAVLNDVLQHIHEDEVGPSLQELSRVLVPGGALLIRTNGARRFRRERDDWRAYDAATLRTVVTDVGLRIERLTYANMILALWGVTRGAAPKAPTDERHGIPLGMPSHAKQAIGLRILSAEAAYLRRSGASLPFGHNLFALATKPDNATV